MKSKEIHVAIDATLSELLDVISSFDQEQFNIAPSEESWTPGQVAQHLVLSIAGFVQLLKGPTEETTRRPDEHIERIKSIFLNFSVKLKSPGFIIPEKKEYSKEDLLHSLKGLKAELENIIETSDLDKTCTLFALPGGQLGYLTRQETLAFVLYHTQRHIHQLKRILEHESYATPTAAGGAPLAVAQEQQSRSD